MKKTNRIVRKITSAVLAFAAAALFVPQDAWAATVNNKMPMSGLYLELGPAYTRSKGTGTNEDSTIDYAGALFVFGNRWQKDNRAHKFQLESGYLFHNESSGVARLVDAGGTQQTRLCEARFRSSIAPLLATYNYCILIRDGNYLGEWRFGPTAGMIWVRDKYEEKIPGGYVGELKDSTHAFGASVGFTIHLPKAFYLDIGYRYLRAGSLAATVNGQFLEKGSLQLHQATLSLGISFPR